MATVKAIVITGHGTNCERESAHALRQSGAGEVSIVYYSDLLAGRVRLSAFNFLFFPGGFLDGDDLGAAQAAALRWRHGATADGKPLSDQLSGFLQDGGLVLGVCNGFQLLTKLGLLPALGGVYFERQASLANNDSGRFEDRWVNLKVNADSPCVFTQGLDELYLPIRHGEGKMVFQDQGVERAVLEGHLDVLRYVDASGQPTLEYPANPNGSPHGIAGLCDPTGRIMGLMPHPEAYNHPTNHPGWTRGETSTLGVELIAGGVRYLAAQ